MRCSEDLYFDNAATSYPKPKKVVRAVVRTLKNEGGNPGRSGHRLSLAAAKCVFEARCTVADFFSVKDERCIVFTKNATEAINMAIAAFTERGGHVLCSDLEHNAVLRPLYARKDKGEIDLEIFSAQKGAQAVQKMLRSDSSLVICTQASNICPFVADARSIGHVCRAHGVPFVLDCSQSAGHMPLSLPETGADAICVPAHKGLLGIMGAGALIFARPQEGLPPFLLGGSGAFSRSRKMPDALPEHFEAGTLPLPAIAAFAAGIREVCERGTEQIRAHISALEGLLLEGLSVIPHITLHTGGFRGGGILCFSHDRLSPAQLANALDARGIFVRAGLHCAPLAHETLGTPSDGCVRISIGCMNTKREGERFLSALSKIAVP